MRPVCVVFVQSVDFMQGARRSTGAFVSPHAKTALKPKLALRNG